jgi:hypothetical protein
VRPLNSVVRLHVEAPELRITPEAKLALERKLASSQLAEPRATVIWASGGVRSHVDASGKVHAESMGPPGWSVAVYDGVTLPPFQKCDLSGVPFCFVQAKYPERLNGAILHCKHGRFEVEERAI